MESLAADLQLVTQRFVVNVNQQVSSSNIDLIVVKNLASCICTIFFIPFDAVGISINFSSHCAALSL